MATNATATKTPAPTTVPAPAADQCRFAGMSGCCAAGTLSNKLVQLGGTHQRSMSFVKTCALCANKLAEQRDTAMQKKFEQKLPDKEVLDVVICNAAKVEFLAQAAKNDGEGLVSRKTENGKPACSCQNWNGEPCPNPAGKKAVAYRGMKFALCGSCETAAKVVSVRDKMTLMSPIDTADADRRAKRQDEEMTQEKKKRADMKSKTPAPAPAAEEPSVYEQFVLESIPPRAPTAAGLKVVRHLGE